VAPAGVDDGALTLTAGATEGTWTSPWLTTPEPFTETVPSWQADTPGGSWLGLDLQVRTSTTESHWYTMANWAFGTTTIERETVGTQADAIGRIVWDTFRSYDTAPGGDPVAYRLRARLHGDGTNAPTLRQVASTSSAPGTPPPVSEPITTKAVELNVPAYSQMTHAGEYPKYGGGGEVWCSPTSTAMVLAYWGAGPSAADLAGLPKDKVFDRNGRKDGQVDWAALHVWDYGRGGAGNWPFNTAYAASYGLDASVREYSTLREVERWIRDGVPVIISINWNNTDADTANDLDGAAIPSSAGHLMVAIGFTATGDVIVADPAAASNAEVRRTYRRDQFERNWLRASNGATYIVQPASRR
jgi:peptidase C39-like protein